MTTFTAPTKGYYQIYVQANSMVSASQHDDTWRAKVWINTRMVRAWTEVGYEPLLRRVVFEPIEVRLERGDEVRVEPGAGASMTITYSAEDEN